LALIAKPPVEPLVNPISIFNSITGTLENSSQGAFLGETIHHAGLVPFEMREPDL
jgi:hypothetical protein